MDGMIEELDRQVSTLTNELAVARKERDAFERKYIEQLTRNNNLWNAAAKTPEGLKLARSVNNSNWTTNG